MATKYTSTISTGLQPIRMKGDTKCPFHRENDVIFSCRHCDELICSTCTITAHKAHIDSFTEISKNTNQQKNTLQTFINETENIRIVKIDKEMQSTRQEILTCQSNYKKLSDNIKKQRDLCKMELDKITENYLQLCDNMETASINILQQHITDLGDNLNILIILSTDCKKTLQTGTPILIHDSVSEIQDMDLADTPHPPDIDMTELTPAYNIQNHLEQAMGNIKTPTDHLLVGSEPTGHSKQGPVVRPKLSKSTETGQASTGVGQYKLCDSPTVISQFLYPDPITSICPTPDGRAWLCHWKTNTVKLINNKGIVLQKVEHNSNITNISVDPTTGRLWFCCWGESTICEVSTSSTPVTRFTTEGYSHSLCVTREGRVVVGTWGRQGYKVVMYTADGQVLHTATVEESGGGYVRSITQCGVTGNIAVVSSKLISGDGSGPNNYRRHIIVYNPTLQSLFHYRGEGIQARGEGIQPRGEGIQARGTVTPDTFDPITVVYDSKGNIVTADRTRKTIELISGAGKYIKTLHTNKGGQGAVGIQKDDVLWSYLQLDTGKDGIKLVKYYSD